MTEITTTEATCHAFDFTKRSLQEIKEVSLCGAVPEQVRKQEAYSGLTRLYGFMQSIKEIIDVQFRADYERQASIVRAAAQSLHREMRIDAAMLQPPASHARH